MSTLIAPTIFEEDLKVKKGIIISDKHNNNTRHVLKCKHSFKPKCDKALKRKLRKYKLRKNGEEDPEVIDVSHIFLSCLKIKSPSKSTKSSESVYNIEELRPRNYLFKMGRKKQKIKSDSSEPVVENCKVNEKDQISVTPEGQEKKQTNAFKLLMDSRNKSIGSNSPGKEKICGPSEQQDIIEKKNIKVKRNLALQKMAEAKGALKKKELEEYQEKCINRKMEKRAERLKSMIASKKPNESKNEKEVNIDSTKQVTEVVEILNHDSKSNNSKKSKSKSLQLVDIFQDVIKSRNISPDKKVIPKEDDEFLKKLSPSIKKKENMLCYFRKLEKKSDTSLDVDDGGENTSEVIKVKISVKSQKRMKKKKLSLSKEPANEILKDHNVLDTINNEVEIESHVPNGLANENSSSERKKRKRKENLAEIEIDKSETVASKNPVKTEETRPKRNIKRPVKYVDDVQLSSSDDELHIFTPKKRKHCENKSKHKEISNEIIVSDEDSETISKPRKPSKNLEQEEKTQKKATKLAPIFVCKPQLNPEQIEAKQKFLYSGVPDQIKKVIAQQKNLHIETSNDFPTEKFAYRDKQ
uniref:Uncharacterized protein n=1 Tax=Pectinophora gossypiella TaxID=13191 RepID=A0A1E1W5Y7_PECGO